MAESSISVGDISAKLRVDLSDWSRGLTQAAQQLQTFQAGIAGRVTPALAQTSQALTTAGAQAQAFGTQMQAATRATSAWSAALAVAGGLGIATSVGAMVGSLKAFTGAVVEAGTRFEALRAQFSALQGVQAAQASLDALFRTAQRLGVEFTPLANAFRQFQAATAGTSLEGAKTERVFNQIVTGMRAMGATSDQVGRALLALQQMVSKGTVSLEELRGQMSEALPGSMSIASRSLETITQELTKLIEKGIDATTFVQAFGNQIEQEFGGKATVAVNTLASAWTRLANEFDQLKAAIAASGLGDALKDIYTWMARIMETWRQARAERDKQLGGQPPTIPQELRGLSPAIEARDKEIARLRADALDRRDFGAMLGGVNVPGLSPHERSAANEARIRDLQAQQREDIARLQRQLLAEGAAPGATGPGPADTALDAITKALESGKARLRQMDIGEGLLPGLELAKEKTQEWRKVLDEVFEQVKRIPEPLLKAILPSVQQLIAPANALMEALSRDADLGFQALSAENFR